MVESSLSEDDVFRLGGIRIMRIVRIDSESVQIGVGVPRDIGVVR